MSASIVAVENPVTIWGVVAKVAMAIRSPGGLARMNERAAAAASASGLPFIDWDRSTASTTLFARPRFCAELKVTRLPFSRSRGGFAVRFDVTTLTLIDG
jgi:hypothetical protein